MRWIVGDVHRGDNTIGVRIVIGIPRLMRLVSDRSIARFVAPRRHGIDLLAQGEKPLVYSPSHVVRSTKEARLSHRWIAVLKPGPGSETCAKCSVALAHRWQRPIAIN